MLHLLSHPHWAARDDAAAAAQPLPVTVPGALLLVLAAHGDWLDRERLAAIFWPDAAPGDALHHLRVNLHRARSLAAGWGHGAALQAERTRVRLALASDVAALGAAIAGNDAAALLRHRPLRWLDGYRLPAFGGFAEWCESEGRHLASAWRQACERALPLALRAGQAAAALALFEAWQADGGQALPGLEALDATVLDAEAATAWRALRNRLAGAAPPEAAVALPAPPGRAAEQQRLLGSGVVAVVVLGEPGVGKSTLLDSAFPAAPRLQGREGLDGLPYRPLLDVLRERLPLLRRWLAEPQGGIGAQLVPYRLDLARLLPELAPVEALPALDAWTAKARLVEALARCFEAFGNTLRVDDLQWCDPATLEWLALLAHRGGLRWRATARRHELGAAASAMLDALRAARLLDEQALLPLTRAGLAEACHVLWPDLGLDAPRLDRLYAASGGSPFIVNELVAAGGNLPAAGALPERASELVLRRLRSVGLRARHVVEAAAVFVQPVPAEALGLIAAEAGETGGDADTDIDADADTEWRAACDAALGAGLLRAEGHRLVCAHDLIRHATLAAVGPTRAPALQRRAALWLATQPEPDALAIAAHWRAAQEPQTALAWLHHGAGQLKSRGRFDEARALWRQVADASLDAAQSLRARLELAGVDFFDDLAGSRAALEAVRVQIGAVADDLQRDQIEGRVLAALVDNRVFAGDLAHAREHAKRLRSLLPRLAEHERIDAIEVLIELAMREPDIEACWALLAQLRRAAPRRGGRRC